MDFIFKGAPSTDAPTNLDFTLWRTDTTSLTAKPPSFTNSAATAYKLEVPGHKRLAIDFGQPIREIIA